MKSKMTLGCEGGIVKSEKSKAIALMILSILMFLGAFALALYVGIWVMLVGGIVGIINAISVAITTGAVVSVSAVTWGVIKILFSGFVGWIILVLLLKPSIVLAEAGIEKIDGKKYRPRRRR